MLPHLVAIAPARRAVGEGLFTLLVETGEWLPPGGQTPTRAHLRIPEVEAEVRCLATASTGAFGRGHGRGSRNRQHFGVRARAKESS